MSIPTESYITLNDTDKIGLSDTLDNYSIDDIKASGYVGAYDPLRTNCKTATKMSMWSGMEEQKTPFNPEWTGSPYPWSHKVYAGDGAYTGAVFVAVVWLYRTIPGLSARVINESNIEDYKLVTEMPANKMYYTVPPLSSWNNQVCATSWSEERTYPSSYYAPDTGTLDYHSNYGNAGDVSVQVDDIYPYMMFEYDGYLYFQLMSQEYTYYASWMINSETSSDWDITPYGSSALTPFTEDSDISLSTSYNAISRSGEANSLAGCDFNTIVPYDGSSVWAGPANNYEVYAGVIDASGKYLAYYCYGGAGLYYSTFRCFATLATKADSLLYFGNSGVKIIADKPYKPIIENGVVTGITDDMTEPSELDNWDMGSTDHGISPSDPPTPLPDPFDVDPETYGWSGGEVSGMVKYYLLTSGQMNSLQTAMASNTNWTIDYLNCVVSCFVVPNSGIFFDAPIPTTVKFKLDNATQWDTGVACSRIQGTKNKSGGTIEIPRLTNTFYDFEPYSDYSVYIPFCGRIPIKGNLCLGREIKVTYYPDVPTCSLTAVVSCGGATIAIAKGSFGTMTPVTSNGSDRKTAAVIGDVAPIITGIGTGIVGVALGNPLIVGAGAAQALGGVMGGVKETVQSYAYSVGSSGDSSFFGAGNRCYYYANYPLIDEVVNNSMFGHSVGYLCNTVGKLSGFKGFTICANPHVTFSATSEEREEIERLLSMGVIL